MTELDPIDAKMASKDSTMRRSLLLVLVVALVLRLVFLLTYVDLRTEEYWEYGYIAQNVIDGRGYSYFYVSGDSLKHNISPVATPLPSAFMPPGYVVYLIPFLLIPDVVTRNVLLLLVHALASTAYCGLIFVFTRQFVDRKSALLAGLLAAALPEFIYATFAIGTTAFFQLGAISILFLLYRWQGHMTTRRLSTVLLLVGILVMFRSEFIAFGMLILLSYAYKRAWRQTVVAGAILATTLAPWAIRNTITLSAFVPLSTNAGMNFYRGHNPYALGVSTDSNINSQIVQIPQSSRFEVDFSRIYFQSALATLQQQPLRQVALTVVKLFNLVIWDPYDERAYHPAYYVPWMFVLVFSIIGLCSIPSWRDHTFFYLYLLYSISIPVTFFVLPRYQTMMKTALIPFAAYGIRHSLQLYRNRQLRHHSG